MPTSPGFHAAEAAIRFLRSQRQNDKVTVESHEILTLFYQNTCYSRLCDSLRRKNLDFENDELAQHLSNKVPEFDLRQDAAETSQPSPTSTPRPSQRASQRQQTTPTSESQSSRTSDHYLTDELDELPYDFTRFVDSEAKKVLKTLRIPQSRQDHSHTTVLDAFGALCQTVNDELSADDNFRYDEMGFTVLIAEDGLPLKYKRVGLQSLQPLLIQEVKWLKSKLRRSMVQPRHKRDDHKLSWWMGQALHYGIPVALHIEDIKVAMQKAVVDGTFVVPERLVKLRRKLKVKFERPPCDPGASADDEPSVKPDSDSETERRKKRKTKAPASKKTGSKKHRRRRSSDTENTSDNEDEDQQDRRDYPLRSRKARTDSHAIETDSSSNISDTDGLDLDDDDGPMIDDYGGADGEAIQGAVEAELDVYDFPYSETNEADEEGDGGEHQESNEESGHGDEDNQDRSDKADHRAPGGDVPSKATGFEKTLSQNENKDGSEPGEHPRKGVTAARSSGNTASSRRMPLFENVPSWAKRIPCIRYDDELPPEVDVSRQKKGKKAVRRFVPDEMSPPPPVPPGPPSRVPCQEELPTPSTGVMYQPRTVTELPLRTPSSVLARAPPGFVAQAHPNLCQKTEEFLSFLPPMPVRDREVHFYLEQFHYNVDTALNAFVEDNDLLGLDSEPVVEDLERHSNEEDRETANALSVLPSRGRDGSIDSEDRDFAAAVALSLKDQHKSNDPTGASVNDADQIQTETIDFSTALHTNEADDHDPRDHGKWSEISEHKQATEPGLKLSKRNTHNVHEPGITTSSLKHHGRKDSSQDCSRRGVLGTGKRKASCSPTTSSAQESPTKNNTSRGNSVVTNDEPMVFSQKRQKTQDGVQSQQSRPFTGSTPIPASGMGRLAYMKLDQRPFVAEEPLPKDSRSRHPFPANAAKSERRADLWDAWITDRLEGRNKDEPPHPLIRDLAEAVTNGQISVQRVSVLKDIADSCTNAFQLNEASANTGTSGGEALRLHQLRESRRLNSKANTPWPPYPPPLPNPAIRRTKAWVASQPAPTDTASKAAFESTLLFTPPSIAPSTPSFRHADLRQLSVEESSPDLDGTTQAKIESIRERGAFVRSAGHSRIPNTTAFEASVASKNPIAFRSSKSKFPSNHTSALN